MRILILVLMFVCGVSAQTVVFRQSTDTLKLVCSVNNATGYQWYDNGALWSGKTNSVLSLNADSIFYSVKRRVYCTITNGAGSTNVGYWYFYKNGNNRVINRKRN